MFLKTMAKREDDILIWEERFGVCVWTRAADGDWKREGYVGQVYETRAQAERTMARATECEAQAEGSENKYVFTICRRNNDGVWEYPQPV
jgi:hypothetical protein